MRNRNRVIAAAAVTVTLAAGGTAAAAAATGGKSVPATHGKVATGKSQGAVDTGLANRLGISPDRLNSALRAAKSSLRNASRPSTEEFYAAIARNLGIPVSRVRQAFPAEQPSSKRGAAKQAEQAGHETLAAAVAQTLHVSTARAMAALRPLFAAGRADESSAAFAAAARSLGVSVEQLNSAVVHAKMRLGGGH